MNLPDLPDNSHKFKTEKRENETLETRKVEKVIKGTAKIKKNNARRFADIFLAEDRKNVKDYILMDVLVPSIKKAIDTIISEGTHMFLWGSKGGGSRTSSGSKIAYSSIYDGNRRTKNKMYYL